MSTILNGLTTMLRLAGSATHAYRLNLTPETTMKEYLAFAQAHGGRLLYGTRLDFTRMLGTLSHVLLFATDTSMMVVGDVAQDGDVYNPRTWPSDDPYQMPLPWADKSYRTWFKLDNVRRLDDFDPSDYETYSKVKEPEPLADVFASKMAYKQAGKVLYTRYRSPRLTIRPIIRPQEQEA